MRDHLADLDVARVRAEQDARADPEAVLHVRRRVIGREAELREVVLLELDLGAVGDGEARGRGRCASMSSRT